MIGLCTDSNSQLPRELAARYGIEVVPQTVFIDGVELLEGVDIDADQFYEHFAGGAKPEVATSPPSVERFDAAYRRLADRGCDEVVSIHVTSALSGTVGVARAAAERASVPVHVVDSGTASFGISCCVWAAALAERDGAPAPDVVRAASDLSPRIGVVLVIGVPQLAVAGGRASSLDLESDGIPVLAMTGGSSPEVLSRVRTIGAAVVTMADYALRQGDAVNVALGTSDETSRPVVEALQEALEAADQVVDIVHYRIGPSVGAHTGPGTAALFVFPAT